MVGEGGGGRKRVIRPNYYLIGVLAVTAFCVNLDVRVVIGNNDVRNNSASYIS